MDFASDARRLYDALKLDREDTERIYLRLAFGLRDTRNQNGVRVEWLARGFATASLALAVQIACWTWAPALLRGAMDKTSAKAPDAQAAPPALPSDTIPAVPSWVFISEKRGGNPPPRQA